MRSLKTSTKTHTTGWLMGFIVFAMASTANAWQTAPGAAPVPPSPAGVATAPAPTPPPAAAPAETPRRKLQVGLAFLPMARGKFDASNAGMSTTVDAAFAYGAGLSVGYEVIPGLVVGLAPQVMLNGKPKESTAPGGKQWDVLARVAYQYTIPEVVTLYAEVLPGYSIFYPPGTSSSKGLIVAAGVGAAVDFTDQVFVNFGVGYQMGFQSQSALSDYQTNFIRVALGGGMRF